MTLRAPISVLSCALLASACSLALSVDGVQCESDADCAFASQPGDPRVCQEQLCVRELPASLPVVVDRFYLPSGRVGESASVVSEDCPRRAGEARGRCHRFTLEEGTGVEDGVTWVRPAGTEPLSVANRARSVSFWAWTEGDDLSVRFGAGRTASDDPVVRTAPLLVGDRPRQYHVDLELLAGRAVESPFEWLVEGRSDAPPVALFIDDLVWSDAAPPAELIPNRRVYAHGEPIVVSYSGGGGGSTDWLGMYLWTETPGGAGITSEA